MDLLASLMFLNLPYVVADGVFYDGGVSSGRGCGGGFGEGLRRWWWW